MPWTDAFRLPPVGSGWGALRSFSWRRRGTAAPAADDTGSFAAWEAELTAYARLRTGLPSLKVEFALAATTGWRDEIFLARPSTREAQASFQAAELELEHVLAHSRHGCREATLLWHAWTHPTEPIALPWPPWDQVALPPEIIRAALADAVPALELPPGAAMWRVPQREAARWLAAAWADGVHRALEITARPGLAERLPLPEAPERPSTWEAVLRHLAAPGEGDGPSLIPVPDVREAADRLAGITPDDLAGQVQAVIRLAETLGRRKLLPPSHKQRPPWLRPAWGQWRHAAALRAALDRLARSPTSIAVAKAMAPGRFSPSHVASGGVGLGRSGRLSQADGPGSAPERRGPAAQAPPVDEPEPRRPDAAGEWGVDPSQSLPSQAGARAAASEAPAAEGQGTWGMAAPGAGPGALGALRIVTPSPEDRAAYWQLRGALAPEIERLIERLKAAGDDYYAAVPRRFRRAGRLDRSRLPAAMAGREAVFTQLTPEPEPAHALCLLLDCSASMGSLAQQLREAAILVESAAAAVRTRVSAFAFGAEWERMETPSEGAPLVALGRELHPHGGTPFGPAVEAAAEWLAHQPYERKRLWVFSDGQWSARDRANTAWRPDLLQHVVVWVLGETAPEPPAPAMRIVAVPTLAELVQRAPAYFWPTDTGAGGRSGGRGAA